ncbi:hypothetical protein PMZ80_003932 [Knufia obscura]|uniref:FAS1 domain-containing protein n=2 Tax=Knufia TaxID=430999 RepID=A0AAN8ELV0_9EURO|nr:hypothetical protein PMZ80_003932 [Knufia obscura]KAK5952335.1 hypothetical protein OHC33_006808 [Knufia fluminis]
MKTAAIALALASTAVGQSLTEVLSSSPQLSNLTTLLQPYADQFSNLTNITLLAPDNNAISTFLNTTTGAAVASQPNLVQAILNYHVLQGNYSNITNTSFIPTSLQSGAYANVTGGQRVEAVPSDGNVTFFSGLLQNSSVVNASIPFDQGTVHIISQFLTLPQNVSATAVALNLTSAVGAIQTLNLTQQIDNTEDLTVFLPNNAAFQRVGGNLANLSTTDLANILSYHVVPGRVLYSTQIMNGSSVGTLSQGSNLTARLEGEDVYINQARVIRPNVLVANGVIHVIDRVLNPANATAAPNTSASSTEEAFAGATSASDEPFTSGVPTPTSAIESDAGEAQATGGSSSSSGGAFRPLETGAIGMAALFGGAAAVMNM